MNPFPLKTKNRGNLTWRLAFVRLLCRPLGVPVRRCGGNGLGGRRDLAGQVPARGLRHLMLPMEQVRRMMGIAIRLDMPPPPPPPGPH